MTLWLSEQEGAQLRFEFEAEIARLKAPEARHATLKALKLM
jgi:hypothetical protein